MATVARLEALAAALEAKTAPKKSRAGSGPGQGSDPLDGDPPLVDWSDAKAVERVAVEALVSARRGHSEEQGKGQGQGQGQGDGGVGTGGEDELFVALRVARLLLRARFAGTERVFASEALSFYLDVMEGGAAVGQTVSRTASRSVSQAASTEAITCLVNALYVNPGAFQRFEALQGVDRVLAAFCAAGSAARLRRCARVLNLCVQNRTVLAEQASGAEARAKARGALEGLVTSLASRSTACLAYCVRTLAPEPFPGSDRSRVDLCLEIMTLQVLLASQLGQDGLRGPDGEEGGSKQEDFLTQLGFVIVEMLLLPLDLPLMFEVKCKVIVVLTFMPSEYANFLSANGAFAAILEVLERQFHSVLVQGKADAESRLIPALLVLSAAAENSPAAREQIKWLIFPADDPEKEALLAEREKEAAAQGVEKKQKMQPDNVEEGSLFSFMLQAMGTPASSNTSRVSAELMWHLCQQSGAEFMKRTGLGNAVGFLQMKGLINIPGAG